MANQTEPKQPDADVVPIAGGAQEPSPVESRITVEDFCALANKFISQRMYREAISLYETAVKIFPSSLALKINLGRARDLQKRMEVVSKDHLRNELEKEREDADRLASRYIGLGLVYLERQRFEKALELFELAKYQNTNLHLPHYHLGSLFYQQDDLDRALAELELARDISPFHEETHALLGKIYIERGDYRSALQNSIDAFLLSMLRREEGNPLHRGRIKFLFDKLGMATKQARNEHIRARMKGLNRLMGALDERKKQFLESSSFAQVTRLIATAREHKNVRTDRLRTALRLRRFPVFESLTDDELYKVAKLVEEQHYESGVYVFHEGDDSGHIYVVDSGRIKLVCPTPVGEQEVGMAAPGEYFGEINFIDKANHVASAMAMEDATLWLLSNAGLDSLFEVEREIAVHFYWNFWKALAKNTRRTNELMKGFFADMKGAMPEVVEKDLAEAKEVEVGVEEKVEVLATRGLSSKELRLLATFSTEKRFDAGEIIFREGDPGDKLYIILDGKIIISKDIPGVGEEALAIFERGDFFGEMALVDQSPRSADAKAHAEGVTLLAIDKKTLDEILSLDVESAYQFLHLLCKILTHRLREITMKLTRWRVMSGGF